MFKIATVVLASIFISNVAVAQQDYREVNNYIPGIADRIPDGATGPGVVYTSRAVGKIIAVGAPITKNYVIGNTCYNQAPQINNQRESSINPGTIAGAVVGAALGSRFGGGAGKDAMTIGGAVLGSNIGTDVYNSSKNQQQVCQNVFETRLVGYSFIAQYQHIQVQGFMRRQPQIGEDVEIILRSVIYAGN